MLNKNELLFFISCTPDPEEIKKFKDNDKIVSIYHVCGVEPWLIVCKIDSLTDAIQLNTNFQLNIKYKSFSSTTNMANELLSKEILNTNPTNNKITFWILIKDSNNQFSSFIKEADKSSDDKYEISEIYQIFGEYNFIVKLLTSNINGVDTFLSKSREKGMSTSTKCVLSKIKENGRNFDDIEKKISMAEKTKKDTKYAVSRIMANTKGFIQKSRPEQESLLSDKLTRLGIFFTENTINNIILDPNIEKSEYSQDDLRHPNNLIDRYSVKLNRNNWLKTLLFFKAAHGKKDELEEALQEKFLGVTPSRFARKLYHITGDYDFFIPFDCSDLDELTKSIDKFWKWQEDEKKELTVSFTNTICRPTEGRGEGTLDGLDIPFIESLLINATQMNIFEERIKTDSKRIFLPILEDKELVPAEEGISPREDYVRNKLRSETIDSLTIEDYIERKFKSFEDIGLESTIEFEDGALIQALSKFYFKNITSKKRFLEEIKEKVENYEIIAISYEPFRDPLTVMCILMVKDLVELEVFFKKLTNYCKKIEFHIIFHQTYYSKVIEQNIRCKPCFYPFNPQKDCNRECDIVKWETCKDRKKCVIQRCGKCIRYILPRTKNRILNINFKKNIEKEIEISLVGIDISLSQFFVLEKFLDQGGYRKKIFDNYKNYENHCRETNKESPYGTSENISKEYESIVDVHTYRKKYKEAIEKVLEDILNLGSPDIIIFPEYSIPSYVHNEIRKMDFSKNCIIIAGSHINNGFNICPIIFNEDDRKKIYYYYKNNFSEFEEYLGLITNKGTAYLKFLNTNLGNLYVQVCFDAFTTSGHGVFNNVDILLVTSFNPSSKFIEPLKNKANEFKFIVAYANTINNKEENKSNFFVPPNNGLNPNLRGVKSFHKEQWSGFTRTNEKIFEIIPPNCQFEEKKINDFNFKIKNLRCNDIIQLDIRRG